MAETADSGGEVRRGAQAPRSLFVLVALVGTSAVVLAAAVGSVSALDAPLSLSWWMLLPLVYVAELSVVHGRSKRQIRSFSLSEIPVVIGLYFASPIDLLLAVAAGNLIALYVHRGHRGLRLVFNVAQFMVVTTVSMVVFRLVLGVASPIGVAGWLGALTASAVGTLVGVALIGAAMRASGAHVDHVEERWVAGVALIGATLNTALGLSFAVIAWFEPAAVWLAAVPTVIVYFGYRTYVKQLEERSQLSQLYEASLSLHRSTNIENALLATAEQARTIVDAAIGAVILFADGPDGIAYLTEAGGEDSPVVMKSISGPGVPIEWAQVLSGQPVIHSGTVMRPGSGNGVVASGMAVPLVGADRRLLGILIAADRLGDIDEFGRHHLERLETLAGMLTVVLQKERLEDSLHTITALKERLEEAARSKDQFIASISHELRTPLTAVVGLSDELTRNASGYEQADLDEFLWLIAQQSAELSYIVEDLLVAARADANQIPLHLETIDIEEAVTHVIAGQQVLVDDVIPLVLSDGCPLESYADPLRVRQIVRNLLTNAVRYGGADIAVHIEGVGRGVAIVVSDDGHGVAPGEESAIFEAYQRASGGRLAPESIGLGLAVSRQLARSMGGELGYRRNEERTEFVLELPISPAPIRSH